MGHIIKGRNAHQILPLALDAILKNGKGANSRNGAVLSFEEPCIIEYECPIERVVFHEERNANPFFHFMECLWMLAGRNDVALPAAYVKTMSNFSDDGVTFNGAYGYRWRKHFGIDQILTAINMLRLNKADRRVVLQMWDARTDLGSSSKDIPCNTQIALRIVDDRLDMHVFNRSNDLVWGALGANAVHMSFLQEFIATAIGVDVGRYFQISSNMHLYVQKHIHLAESMASPTPQPCPYEIEGILPFPILRNDAEAWLTELDMLLEEGTKVIGLKEPFFRKVAVPLMDCWTAYRQADWAMALNRVSEIQDPAWQRACREWLDRKRHTRARMDRAQDDGVSYE